MRSFFLLSLTIIFTLGLFLNDAQAKRFGGGKSFGMQRTASQFSRSSAFANPNIHNNNIRQPFSSAKKWLAPLAGLALGGLLASLFMGNGIGSGILSWLVIGSVLFLLFTLIRKKLHPQALQPIEQQSSHHMNNVETNPSYSINDNLRPLASYTSSSLQPSNSLNFNVDDFLREAKVKFIRLQAAYDQKNINDLKEFTTPDVFAEIQLQLHERNNMENKTEIITLETELLDATTEFQVPVASVRFSGTIREDNNTLSLNEIWHFRKDQQNLHWIVSGIQQT